MAELKDLYGEWLFSEKETREYLSKSDVAIVDEIVEQLSDTKCIISESEIRYCLVGKEDQGEIRPYKVLAQNGMYLTLEEEVNGNVAQFALNMVDYWTLVRDDMIVYSFIDDSEN